MVADDGCSGFVGEARQRVVGVVGVFGIDTAGE
jgi:hypothetical protein